MKIDQRTLRDFLKKHASNRCAAFVADTFLGLPLSRQGQEHLNRNGGEPSDRAVKLLAWCQKYGSEGLTVRILYENAFFTERTEAATAMPEWDEMGALQLCNKPAYEAELAARETAVNDWWENEGKYEERLENSGEYKYFLYAADRAANEGRELTARDYYLGGE